MATGFTTWTVLDNKPVDKLEGNLWYVSGKMPGGNERKMTVARRADGDLVIFNAIALTEPEMAAIEAFGRPAYLVVPNAFHRQDAFIWKQRYPQMKVVAPRGSAKAVAKAVPVDLMCDGLPPDPDVVVTHPHGLGDKEALMTVRHGGAGQTLVACDALLNMTSDLVKFPFSFLLAPLDRLSTPRFTRWVMMKDGKAWRAHLDALADSTTRIIPGHGKLVTEDAPATLRSVSQLLA